jgi:hypothetical protein
MPYKLGRHNRTHNPNIPKFAHLTLGATLSPAPSAVDYSAGLPADLGMMLNDRLGDCTCAAFFHALQVWSYHTTGNVVTYPDANVEQLYQQADGYNPADPSTDRGGNEQNVLTFLMNEGAPIDNNQRHKLSAFVELDVKNSDHIKHAIHNCAVVYIGFTVPSYLMNGEPPLVWEYDPNWNGQTDGGHAVIIVGYDEHGLKVISWGKTYTMSWIFWDKFVDEAYALADKEWVNIKGTTPAGLTIDQLEAAMGDLKG